MIIHGHIDTASIWKRLLLKGPVVRDSLSGSEIHICNEQHFLDPCRS